VAALLAVLDAHEVRYLVTGSSAALFHGLDLEPGDLDVTPALDCANLGRLAAALEELEAAQYPEEPFGRWETDENGERRYATFEPTEADRAARSNWKPDPADEDSFDHLLRTRHGTLDVVPRIAGDYDELSQRAVLIAFDGREVWVESLADLLATLTVPRRQKDVDRVKALRALQREQLNPSRDSAPSRQP
jgi:hypothetical protein